jgi:formate hydrogenlyase subunit 3/multisubunit Na+/H+ antiporter MnhD subunit
VPLTLFFGLLTLAPLVMALALAGLGLARRATAGLALGLTLVGAVIPIIGLALLAPEVSAGFPLEIALLGNQSSWVALYGRADALAVYAAIGVAVVVAPLLLWMAWRAAPLDAAEEAEVAAAITDEADDVAADEAADDVAAGLVGAPEIAWSRRALGRWQWVGVALALTLETLALWVCFAENIVLLGIVWIALVGVAWWLGELSSEASVFDWRGLTLMVVGPVVWLVTTLLIAGPAGARRLLDLTGAARLPTGHLFVIALALTFAAGGYPALAWLRKRASIATPAGLAAVALAIMPAALFVGARTFSIGATTSNNWAALNIGKPSLTIGIVLTLLGAISVAAAGLLALGRRDPRSLVASLILAQAGWGLVGLGIGAPLSLLGVTLLLATGVLGLGAVMAALVASGAVTADVEPESAGPRILGEPLRPALLFAWVVGVASLVGAPLFAGFAPQQLISADALTGPRLSIPLVGLAWAGSVALAIAMIRATAPAFTAPLVAIYDAEADLDAGDLSDASDTGAESVAEVAADYDDDQERQPSAAAPELRLEELPGVALGVVIVLAGVAPGVALMLASGAAGATMQAGALDGLVASSSSGYSAGVGQWFATAPVIFVVVGALVLAYLRSRMTREIRPIYLAGQEPDAVLVGAPSTGDAVDTVDAVDADTDDASPAELAELPEPTDAWSDLRSALRSGWLTPGAAWLGLDQDDAEDEIEDDAEDDAADEPDAADEDALTPEVTEVTEVTGASAAASTPRGHTPDGAGGQA